MESLDSPVEEEKLAEALAMMGCVPERMEGDDWSVEVFPDRPDLLSGELLARAVRAYLGQDPGLTEYEVGQASDAIIVEESVRSVRPVIVGGRARGIELDQDRLKGLMNLQEDLHWGLGARRRKVSVGLHDASGIEAPFTYKGADPDEVSFVPLRGAEEMPMRRMLKDLEKGGEYAHLVEGHDAWPLIVDAEEQVLSFPPIINGTLTTLTEATSDVFVDVTGTDERACREVLNIVMTQLAELGGTLEAVEVQTPEDSFATPDLSSRELAMASDRAKKLLGVRFSEEDACEALERMGHGARVDGGEVRVDVPAWRSDVLHEVDLVEDIAIGLGYDRFEGSLPQRVTFGEPGAQETLDEQVRRALTGLGYQECMTLTLTSEEEQGEHLGLDEDLVRVENPVSAEHEVLRRRLLPSLLGLAAENTHRDLPQRLFEVGDVVPPSGTAPGNQARAAGLIVASDASFTRIKAHVEALLRSLDVPFEVSKGTHAGLLEGRTARIQTREEGAPVGAFGEVDPRVLENFELEVPCAGFELVLEELFHPQE